MTGREERCHLLELPAEIRLTIYQLAFPVRTVHIWVDRNVYRWRSYTPKSSVSLLATCKPIHHEAAPVFHDNTTVHFSICDEFERPLSRYLRFSPLETLNAASFDRVRKIQLSLHTLTEPLWDSLHAHLSGFLTRLHLCSNVRAIKIHFEFWSTITDYELSDIYETLCQIAYPQPTVAGTLKTGSWIALYEASSFLPCIKMLQDDIGYRSQGLPLLMRNCDVGLSVGPRELIISSVG